jgi:hypothetical protein
MEPTRSHSTNPLSVAPVARDMGYSCISPAHDNFNDSDFYYTESEGITWTYRGFVECDLVGSIEVLDSNTLWAKGLKVSYSQDGGESWEVFNWYQEQQVSDTKFLPSEIKVLTEDDVWVAGRAVSPVKEGRVIVSENNGTDWRVEYSLEGKYFYGMDIIRYEDDVINRIRYFAWVVGLDGVIAHKKWNEYNAYSPDLDAYFYQNYPNPFNEETDISFYLSSEQYVSLDVFNLLGEKVCTLIDERLPADFYTRTWRPENQPSGIYLVRLKAGNVMDTKKIVYQK